MSYISVQFGYHQSKLFNINCQIAPLLDAIQIGAYKEMILACKKREEWFSKEIQAKKKKEALLLKKLAQFDKPKEESKETAATTGKGKGGKKLTKKEQEAEAARLKAEEEERKRKEAEAQRIKEEEERKRKEEEEKKAKEKKPPAKGKGAKEEKVEEHVEETEEQKIEREKKEINDQLKVLNDEIEAFTKKMNLCGEQSVKIEADSKLPKLIELLEKEGDRKFLRNNLQKNGTELLRERKAYVLCHIKKQGEEDVPENIVIDGFCMRTPEEDVKWEEEQQEKEAAAQKGGKKAPPPKKK